MTDANLPRRVQEQAEWADQAFNPPQEPPEETAEYTGGTEGAEGTDSGQGNPDSGESAAESDDFIPAKDDARANDPNYLYQRLKVLGGKYNKEVREVNEVIAELRAENSGLKTENQQLRQQLENAGSDNADPSVEQSLDTIKREVGEDFAQEIDNLIKGRVKPVEQQQAQASAERENQETQEAEKAFFQKLGELMPDWNVIDRDPKFHEWLGQPYGDSGLTRHEVLGDARSNLDAQRAANIFLAFKQEQASVQPEGPSQESEVLPNERPSGNDADPPQGQIIWDNDKIKQFYADKARGKYSQQEAEALEDDMHRAVAEGRMRF